MLSYYGGSYPLAVASYNAGPCNVNKWLRTNGDPRTGSVPILDWIEAIPIFETKNYVQRVLENAVVYNTLREDGRSLPKAPLSFYLGKSHPGLPAMVGETTNIIRPTGSTALPDVYKHQPGEGRPNRVEQVH